MNGFYKLMNPPHFPDVEKSRVARLLHWILLVGLGVLIFDTVILVIFAPETIPTLWLNGLGLAFILMSTWLMRQGKVQSAAFFICMALWGMLAYYLLVSGGVTSPAFGFLNIVIIIGAILLEIRGGLFFGGLSILTGVLLFIAGNNGWLVHLEALPTPSRLFSTHTAIFAGLMFFMVISVINVRDALASARHHEQDLATRNQQLQDEINRREAAQQQEARFGTILEATSDFVSIVDLKGRTLYLNRAGRKLAQMEAIDVSQTDITDFHNSEVIAKLLTEALPTAAQQGTWSGETHLRRQDGSEILVSQVVIAHAGPDGNVEYLSTVMRDLSERERAEGQRLQLALQQERLDFFKEFLGNVSHDLKTPLTIINNSLYLLPRMDNPEKQQSHIDLIKGQVLVLDKYIQDLLTLSQLDNVPEINLRPLDVNLLLKDLQAQLQSIAQVRKISLQLEIDDGLPLIQGDKKELHRALTNLVENAAYYTLPGGTVTLNTFQRDGGAVMQVSDTGIGISAEALPHIFERFYRSKEAHQARSGGTGMGLAIVKRIVDIHQGKIEVESTPGVGTKFRIWLKSV